MNPEVARLQIMLYNNKRKDKLDYTNLCSYSPAETDVEDSSTSTSPVLA
jgi:hypothetical protein